MCGWKIIRGYYDYKLRYYFFYVLWYPFIQKLFYYLISRYYFYLKNLICFLFYFFFQLINSFQIPVVGIDFHNLKLINYLKGKRGLFAVFLKKICIIALNRIFGYGTPLFLQKFNCWKLISKELLKRFVVLYFFNNFHFLSNRILF